MCVILNTKFPKHIAIVMDGNGRWATQRQMTRVAGHKAGVESVRAIINACAKKGIDILSLFAFSSENWARPKHEVKALMDLFARGLKQEMQNLHKSNIRIQFIGDRSRFSNKLNDLMARSECLTHENTGMQLIIAVNYGGRWDILQGVHKIAQQVADNTLNINDITEDYFANQLNLADLPNPDLLIRTSGEQRISNFFLWQMAYTELYFTDIHWPDFREAALDDALAFYVSRQRRFGYTSEQVEKKHCV